MEAKIEKKSKKNKVLIALILIMIAVVAVVIALGIKADKDKAAALEKIAQEENEFVSYGDEAYGIDPQVAKDLDNYRNIVLLGVDTAKIEDESGNRSDGIIIASINEATKEVKLFSVYRDTYLEIEEGKLDKVNHAYAFGGILQSLWTLNHNMDLNIREAIVFSWGGVSYLVDRLNGVDVEVTETERVYMNKHLSSADQITSAGMQTLNGEQAVLFARIRKDSSAGDVRRNERMKIVMEAAFTKAQTLEAEKLVTLAEQTMRDVKTNMRSDKIVELAMDVRSYTIISSEGWPYEKRSFTDNSIYYSAPVTLTSNVSKLHELYFGQTGYVPTATVQDVSERISAKSGYR